MKMRFLVCIAFFVPFVLSVAFEQFRLLADEPQIFREQPSLTKLAQSTDPTQKSSSISPRLDLYGDALPAGASLRLGTVRYRLDGAMGNHLLFTYDGKTLLSLGRQKICFYETLSGKLLRQVNLPEHDIRTFDISPDEKSLAVAAYYFDAQRKDSFYRVILLDLESGRELAKLEWTRLRSTECRRCRFTPDGTAVVIANRDGLILFWDIASKQELLEYKLPQGEVESMDLSPDGNAIAATTRKDVYYWSWLSGEKPIRLPVNLKRTMSVRFSPNGQWLAIGMDSQQEGGCLWDLKTAKVVQAFKSENNRFYPTDLAFTPDSKSLVIPVQWGARSLLFFDLASGKVTRQFDTAPLQPRFLAISPDGHWLATCSFDARRLKMWNLVSGEERGRELVGHDESITAMQFSQDGRNVITASDDGAIRIWNSTTGEPQQVLRHEHWVRGIALSPDGKWLVSNSLDNTVRLWDWAAGKEVHRLKGHGNLGGKRPVVFRSDSRQFYSWGDQDGLLRHWDTATEKALHELAICPSDVEPSKKDAETAMGVFDDMDWKAMLTDIDFSSDGKLLVLAHGQTICVFDADTGKETQKFSSETRWQGLAISPDRKRIAAIANMGKPLGQPLASGGVRIGLPAENELRMIDYPSGKLLFTQPVVAGLYGQLLFSPSGKYLFMVRRTPGSEIAILDSATGKAVYTLENLPNITWSHMLALSPDGKRLACGMADTTVLLWDLPQNYR